MNGPQSDGDIDCRPGPPAAFCSAAGTACRADPSPAAIESHPLREEARSRRSLALPDQSLTLINTGVADRTLVPTNSVASIVQFTDVLIQKIDDCPDPRELNRTLPTAEYLRQLLVQERADLVSVNRAAEARLRTCRRLGMILNEVCPNGGDRKSDLHDARLKLTDLGINGNRSARYRKLASFSEAEFRKAIDSLNTDALAVTERALVRRIDRDRRGNATSDERFDGRPVAGDLVRPSDNDDQLWCSVDESTDRVMDPREHPQNEEAEAFARVKEQLSLHRMRIGGEPSSVLQYLSDLLRPTGCQIFTPSELDTLPGGCRSALDDRHQ